MHVKHVNKGLLQRLRKHYQHKSNHLDQEAEGIQIYATISKVGPKKCYQIISFLGSVKILSSTGDLLSSFATKVLLSTQNTQVLAQ